MKLIQKIAVDYYRFSLNLLAVLSKRRATENALHLFCTPQQRAVKKTFSISENPEPVSFNLDGITIRGNRWNHPSEKKLLIIHGFESSSVNFGGYIMPLVQKGYEVIAFDAPAHGRSGGKQINLPLYLKTIQQAQELYGPLDNVLAHSYGALAATHFMELVPDNEKMRLVLIAPATETTTAIDSFFKLLRLKTSLRKPFDELIGEKTGFPPSHFSIRRAAGNIKGPILWIHDENDLITPIGDALRVQEDHHPNIQFVFTKGLGHRQIYRDPAVMRRVFDFF